jgi:hypothetical protein
MSRSYLTPDEVAAELRVSRGWVLARGDFQSPLFTVDSLEK